jgi:ammonia channel protein AmtB
VVLTDQDVDKIPPDWQNHKAILEQVVPNAELFQLWTNDQLIESDHMIEYLTQLPVSNKHWIEQIKAIGVTLALAIVGTIVIAYIVKAVLGGLRPSEEVEVAGLDLAEHGEEGYHNAR